MSDKSKADKNAILLNLSGFQQKAGEILVSIQQRHSQIKPIIKGRNDLSSVLQEILHTVIEGFKILTENLNEGNCRDNN